MKAKAARGLSMLGTRLPPALSHASPASSNLTSMAATGLEQKCPNKSMAPHFARLASPGGKIRTTRPWMVQPWAGAGSETEKARSGMTDD